MLHSTIFHTFSRSHFIVHFLLSLVQTVSSLFNIDTHGSGLVWQRSVIIVQILFWRGLKEGPLDSCGSSSDLRCWGLISAFYFKNSSHGPSGLCHLCSARTCRALEKSWLEQWRADLGQPPVAPCGQIFANYMTNYTASCCLPRARVNNNTISLLWLTLNLYNPYISLLWRTYMVFSPERHSSLLPPPLPPADFIHEISSSPLSHHTVVSF